MLRSMTAFGKAKKAYPNAEISVEIQSVNKKFLDFQIKLPPEWLFFETSLRNWLSEHIERGHITISLHILYRERDVVSVHLNKGYVEALMASYLELAECVGHKNVEPKELFSAIVREKGIFQPVFALDDNSQLQEQLKETFLLALNDLTEMKTREGALLEKEFLSRLDTLAAIKEQVQNKSHHATDRYRAKITALLQEFKDASPDTDVRIAKEVALMADKLDITEEIARFGFHIQHFKEVASQKDAKPAGKVLEFILQELLREINTLGSKSQETSISKLVIEAKSEIEKMKEQIQNVE